MAESTIDMIGREVFLASLVGDSARLGPAMHRVARLMEDISLGIDEPLYQAGEHSDYFFFVVSGELTLTRAGASPSVFGERTAVGTLDATTDRPHMYTATATKPTHILRLRAVDWMDLMEDNFELTRRIIGRLATEVHRLRLRPPPQGGFDEPIGRSPGQCGELQVVDRIIGFQDIPVLARAGTQALAALAQLGSTTFAAKDGLLFSSDEMRGQLVVVASGEVEVSWQGSPVTARFRGGSLVGGVGALGNGVAPEVRATGESRAIVLPKEDYFDVMEEHFDLARSALAAIAEERELLLDRGS